MGIVVNCISHIMKKSPVVLVWRWNSSQNHMGLCKNLFGGWLSNPLCSPCFLQLCFCSEDRKQVISESRASSLLSSYLTLFESYFSLQCEQAEEKRAEWGQREREWERDKSGSRSVISIARGCQSVISLAGSPLGTLWFGHTGPQQPIRWGSDMRHQRQTKQKLVYKCFTW